MGDEENTKEFEDARAVGQRIFARFDSIETLLKSFVTRFENIELRLDNLEEQNEQRAKETKPMWEKALAEILEVKEDVREVKKTIKSVDKKLGIMNQELLTVKTEQAELEERVETLERKPS